MNDEAMSGSACTLHAVGLREELVLKVEFTDKMRLDLWKRKVIPEVDTRECAYPYEIVLSCSSPYFTCDIPLCGGDMLALHSI